MATGTRIGQSGDTHMRMPHICMHSPATHYHSLVAPCSEVALSSLGVDAALFIGDFGEEDVGLVERIARVEHRKAVILGE
jgi:hypothetical protein